jgi:hypothetical protein
MATSEMVKSEKSKASKLLLDNTHVCAVDFWNHMNDGTVVTGVRADFLYSDNSQSSSSNPNANIGYSGAVTVYSDNKCVKRVDVIMMARRPSGAEEAHGGHGDPAPQGRCKIHSGFGLEPEKMVAEGETRATRDRPVIVLQIDGSL